MEIVDDVVRSFEVALHFHDNKDRINSIDFTADGNSLISSSDDDSINLYDCHKGVRTHTLLSQKYGVGLIRYTHAADTAIHSSTKLDDSLRYLSLHDNKYIRYYKGHTKKVISLCMNPVDNTFISSSLDQTIRLWDLRSPNCQGVKHILSCKPAAVNFHPEGLIFAVAYSKMVKLYDLRSYNTGSFISIPEDPYKGCDFSGIKFSPNGKTILLPTNGSVIHLIDADDGTPIQSFTGHINNKGIPVEASFSPNSEFIFSGSTDGKIHAWHAGYEDKTAELLCEHAGPVQCVQFNPQYMLLVSACNSNSLAFWLPSTDEEEEETM